MEKERKTDVRVKRTYKKLVDGMVTLLEQKMMEDISVLDICDISGVHRATFYKHFDDKYAFLKFFFEMLLKELPYEKLTENASTDDCRKAYMSVAIEVINFVEQHRTLIKNVTDDNQTQLFMSMFTDAVSNLLEHIITVREAEIRINGAACKIPMLAGYYSSAVIGLIKWWVTKGEGYSAADIEMFIGERFDIMTKFIPA